MKTVQSFPHSTFTTTPPELHKEIFTMHTECIPFPVIIGCFSDVLHVHAHPSLLVQFCHLRGPGACLFQNSAHHSLTETFCKHPAQLSPRGPLHHVLLSSSYCYGLSLSYQLSGLAFMIPLFSEVRGSVFTMIYYWIPELRNSRQTVSFNKYVSSANVIINTNMIYIV